MFEVFCKYLRDRTDITQDDLELIRSFSKLKTLKRRQFLLQEGQVCRHYAFITQGCLRQYRIDSEGVEHITRFAIETWWMSDRESFMTGNPSKSYIDALEDSKILLWTGDDFENLKSKIPKLSHFQEELLTRSFLAKDNRIHAAISFNAEEKYHDFIKTYPDIFNRVPLHMIASYLGLSRETLSRIRKQFAQK